MSKADEMFEELREEVGSLSGIGMQELQAINKKCKELGRIYG